jgi:hypothetical protein
LPRLGSHFRRRQPLQSDGPCLQPKLMLGLWTGPAHLVQNARLSVPLMLQPSACKITLWSQGESGPAHVNMSSQIPPERLNTSGDHHPPACGSITSATRTTPPQVLLLSTTCTLTTMVPVTPLSEAQVLPVQLTRGSRHSLVKRSVGCSSLGLLECLRPLPLPTIPAGSRSPRSCKLG